MSADNRLEHGLGETIFTRKIFSRLDISEAVPLIPPMPRPTILVIEDDSAIRAGLCDALESAGYETRSAADGKVGRQSALKLACDLILLDLMLPRGDGFEILRAVRETRPTLPVIVLTARGSERDRVRGLREGADDYVVKPFSLQELLARVQAVLRRSPGRPIDVHELELPAGGSVQFDRREVRFVDGGAEELTERETDLLRYLATHRGRAVARAEILANVWRINPRAIAATRTVDMAVTRLRQKLRDDSATPRVVVTVRGKGYMLAAPPGEAEPE